MKNSRILGTLIALIVVLLFTLVSFLIPVEKNLYFWNGYVFMMLAFGLLFYVSYQWDASNKTLNSKFLGLPLVIVAYRLIVVQFVWTLINYVLAAQSLPELSAFLAIIISMIILCVGCVFLLVTQTGTNIVSKIDADAKSKRDFIKSNQLEVELLIGLTSDKALQKKLKLLVDEIRFSDPMSLGEHRDLEKEIDAKITALKESITNDNGSSDAIIKDISQALYRRNRLIIDRK